MTCGEYVLYGYTNRWTYDALLDYHGRKDIEKFDEQRRRLLQAVIDDANRAAKRAEKAKRTLQAIAAFNPPTTAEEPQTKA